MCDPSDSPWGAASLAAAHKEKGHRSGSGGTGHKPEDALDALPPHAKTASACLPVAEAGIAIWIAAPPGAGKSSTAYRLRRYGFLAVDGEDQGLWPAYCERATPDDAIDQTWLASRSMRRWLPFTTGSRLQWERPALDMALMPLQPM